MGKLKRMDQVKIILQVYLDTGSIKGTARRLNLSKNTVKTYIRRAQTFSEDLAKVLLLPDNQFLDVFYITEQTSVDTRASVFEDKIEGWIQSLSSVGVTRHLLWQEYILAYPQGYSYSQFCRHFRRFKGRKQLTLSLNHEPGEKLQVDFAGKQMRWVDTKTGEVHNCEVLIAVFPYSQYSFVIAVPSQKTTDFTTALNQAFLYFKGLPRVVLSDNLKAFVIRPDRYHPTFNDLCVQLATHYGIDLEAARVRKPKDKASVENMVRTIYTRIYAPLRNEIFHSLADLNEAIMRQLKIHNEQPFQKKAGSRKSIFEQVEAPLLDDLPTDLFQIKYTTKAKVQLNYHVFLGQEKNYYSVPFRYAGKQATVLYTADTVEVYIDNQRVAIHERLPGRDTYLHQTKATHMPKNHLEWKKAQGYDAAYFLDEANKIGTATCWAFGYILSSRKHPSQGFNSCRAILQLAKELGKERVEKTAARCQKIGRTSYTMFKNILSKNLDEQAQEISLFKPPKHNNIRGPEKYK